MLAENLDSFTSHGVQIVPIVAQRMDAVRHYIEETGLPFDILIDERRDTLRAYGVWHRIGLDAWNIARPAVFLVEPDSSISWSYIGEDQRDFPALDALLHAVSRA